MSEILYGLNVSEFRHPTDAAALNAVEKIIVLNKLGEAIENFTSSCDERIFCLGHCLKLDKTNAPRITKILDNVKNTLDFEGNIEIFSHRSVLPEIHVSGINKNTILIPDVVIRCFPDEMTAFLLGQAVTMIKGRMLKMYALSYQIEALSRNIPMAGSLLRAPLGHWKRKAQLTADRGGLLACQDKNAAVKYLAVAAGVPLRMTENISAENVMEQLIADKQKEKPSISIKLGIVKNTALSSRSAWANERFTELYSWVASGEYEKVIEQHT